MKREYIYHNKRTGERFKRLSAIALKMLRQAWSSKDSKGTLFDRYS